MTSLFNTRRMLMILLLMTAMLFAMSLNFAHASSKGTISSVTNTSSGIKITWTKDTSKSGYMIYRKTADTDYELIKTVKGSKKTSWTDDDTVNGAKYVYRVCSYRGSKITNPTVSKVIYRLSKPSITKLANNSLGVIDVTSDTNEMASGYEVRYSKKSSFSSSSTKTVSGATLEKSITGLSIGKKYYVKIRAYIKDGSKKYYSAYSTARSINVKTYYQAYVSAAKITVRNSPDFNSKSTTFLYNKPVTIYKTVKKISTGVWKKVKINSKYYYIYIKKGENPFTTIKDDLDYSDCCTTDIQKRVVDTAIDIYINRENTYSHDNKISEKGVYCMDCSGFSAYVINTAMNSENPVYRLSGTLEIQHDTTLLYNEGYAQEFSATVIQDKGKPDYSKLQPGDLLFFKEQGHDVYNHVGIYLGNKRFIHSTNAVNGVGIYPLEGSYEHYLVRVVRVIPDTVEPINEVKYTSGGVRVYDSESGARNYKSDGYVTVSGGQEVTLLYTSNAVVKILETSEYKTLSVGYISYIDNQGEEHKGFINTPGKRFTE